MCDKRMVGLVALILFRVTTCQRSAREQCVVLQTQDLTTEDAFICCQRNVPMVLHPLFDARNLQRAITVRSHNFEVGPRA